MIKRGARIVPLYFFWLLTAIALGATAKSWMDEMGVTLDWWNLVAHFTLLSVWDYRVTNSILGVEWTLPIEVFWYCFVPLLSLLVWNRRSAVFAVLGSLALYLIFRTIFLVFILSEEVPWVAFTFSPFPYVFAYVLGISAYTLRQEIRQNRLRTRAAYCLTVVALGAYSVWPSVVLLFTGNLYLLVSSLTAFVLVFGESRSKVARSTLSGGALVFLGNLSYGVYFSHFVMIRLVEGLDLSPFALFATVTFLALSVSVATWVLIEKPAITWARRFA